jgi:ubiquinone/menaquinone biosynthesis C-methylase UbiE
MEERKLELRRRYDETVGVYDRRYEEIQRTKYQSLAENLPKKAERILDIGCGTGMFLGELSWRAEFVAGVDTSLEMLRVANVRRGKAALVLADADKLPFADGSFDAVVSITLLQNMPDPAATVREAARVLKPKCIAIMTTLKRKHSLGVLKGWIRAAGLEPLNSGEVGREDVFCIARR